MNHKLLTKFVFSGMQNNKKTLIPYLLAGTMTVMIYYILQSLAHCPYIYKDGVEAFYGAQLISILLEISGQIVAVFATVFLFYTNQFMIRARKKEMGLYGVLGMSKKNITYILAAGEPDECFDQHCHRNCDGDFSEQINASHSL